jgi:Ca2+/H+ antiporter
MPLLRRARGGLLRVARNRRLAAAVGVAFAAPAAWIEFASPRLVANAWWADGLALVLGATGIALLWTALTGVPPDWVDDENK